MLSYSLIKKYDRFEICKIYDMWPDLAKQSYHTEFKSLHFDKIDHIVFTGMGGSGTLGNVLTSILSKEDIHISVVKGFHLPSTADKQTLVVATSVSGNTVETLTVLDSALKAGCKIVGFSSGGKLKEFCQKNEMEWRYVQMLNSPRASFPIYLYSILNILGQIMKIKKNNVDESIKELTKTQLNINSSNLKTNSAFILAKWLSNMPIIYYPAGLQSVAIRFKNSLAENAKMHSIAEDVVEACHNGIMAWERESKIRPILLRGHDDYIETKKLWDILEEYLHINKIEFTVINSVKGNILTKLVNLIYLLDYATIYRAILSKTDPTPTKSIEYIKKKMMINSSIKFSS